MITCDKINSRTELESHRFIEPVDADDTPENRVLRRPSPPPTRRMPEDVLIYVIDDEQGLIELYSLFLKGIGYIVRAFNHRAAALAALKVDHKKPDLVIMDYRGHAMPVDQFIRCCRVLHPEVRILMASGLNETDAWFSHGAPDRFIQKPFTAEEFLREVRSALTA